MRFRPSRLQIIQSSLLVGAVTAGWFTRDLDCWNCWPLAVIGIFCVSSEFLASRLDAGSGASGSHLGIVLAAVLFGPGPAAAIGVCVIAIGWVGSREAGWQFRNNLLICAWFPLITGIAFHWLAAGVATDQTLYDLIIFVTAMIALGVNLLGVAIASRYGDGIPAVCRFAASMLKPVFAAELFSALLTVGAVWIANHLHLVGLVMLAIVLAIFQYLFSELLTSRRRGQALHRMATTDELTGLGNRERFRDEIDVRIRAATETGMEFPVLLMDLDRFKEVNDTLGHSYGDRLLHELGPRLQAAIGDRGFVARLGGDEFGILPADRRMDAGSLEATARALLATVAEPFEVDELALEVGASIGVARYPTDAEDGHGLLRCADIAMYAAKDAQVGVRIYAAEQNEQSVRRLSVLSGFRHALEAGEIVVHYQPIVDLANRRVIGAEGLVRWEHPEHGMIPPDGFVAIVEQSGLIGPLTRCVLEHAISECAQWRREGHDLSVAVNLSVRNLLDRELPGEIERILRSHALPAQALQLEITESMIMSDPERALATVTRLSSLGARLSVDDFGTGHSSLANLRKLPIDELKIDRSFVSPMLADESDLIIVRSTINLSHDLGLRVIAEGVEDGATLERLATLGCDLAQGYHLSRPLSAADFSAWLAQCGRSAETAAPGRAASDALPSAGHWTTTTAGLVVASPEP